MPTPEFKLTTGCKRQENALLKLFSDSTVFPALMPNEAIWGYVARVQTLNSARRHNIAAQLLSSHKSPCTALIPRGPALLVAKIPNIVGSSENLLARHTVAPLFAWLTNADGYRQIAERFQQHRSQQPLIGALGLGLRHARHCPQCRDDDETTHGFSYWRRTHQLRGVEFCGLHQCRLVVGCGSCTQPDLMISKRLLPSEYCGCGRLQVPIASESIQRDEDLLLKISKFAEQLLAVSPTASMKQALPAVMSAALQKWRSEHGLKPSGAAFFQFLQRERLTDALDKRGFRGFRPSKVQVLSKLFREQHSGSPSTRLALFALLFESPQALFAHCQAVTHHDKQEKAPSSQELAEARLLVLRGIALHGTLRRRGRRTPSPFLAAKTLVAKFDLKWWNLADPRTPRMAYGHCEAKRIPANERAADIALSIGRRAAELLAMPGEPQQLTRRALLGVHALLPSLTLRSVGEAALAAHTESAHNFRRRCISWALANGSAFQTHRDQHIYIVRRLVRQTNKDAKAARMITSGKLDLEPVVL